MSRTRFRRCAAITLFACAIALLPGPDMLAAGADTISVTNVNTGTNGQATLSGSFGVTMQGVTLMSVCVWAFPQNGGKVESAGAMQIDNTKMTWGGATVKNLAGTEYTFRVQGNFNDGGVYVAFVSKSVSGGSAATWPYLAWNTADGSPSSPAAGTIAATGIWDSNGVPAPNTITFNANATAFIIPYFTSGGAPPAFMGGKVTINANKTWSSANITGLTSGQTYTPLMTANASDNGTYCAPVVSLTVQ